MNVEWVSQDYYHVRNSDHTVDLVDPNDTPVLRYDTDYRIYSLPSNEFFGRISYEGDFLIFIPVDRRPLRPYRLTVTPENVELFKTDISKWYINNVRAV